MWILVVQVDRHPSRSSLLLLNNLLCALSKSNAKMHFLAALVTTLLLAGTSTLALKLPDNFTIIEAIPIAPEYLYDEAKGNPNVPLINATLTCGREYIPGVEGYLVEGYGWTGVTEKQIKNAASKGGKMTYWEFTRWEENECDWEIYMATTPKWACPPRPAGWRASVSFYPPIISLSVKTRKTGKEARPWHDY